MENLGPVKTDCAFNSVNTVHDPTISALYWKIDKSLRFNPRWLSEAQKIIDALPKKFTALHYRGESDWIAHCKVWKGKSCLGNHDFVDRVINLLEDGSENVFVAVGDQWSTFPALRRLAVDNKRYA